MITALDARACCTDAVKVAATDHLACTAGLVAAGREQVMGGITDVGS